MSPGSASLTDLEARLNRAAEIATPKAKALFLDAIHDMTLEDVMSIYNGAPDAATEYVFHYLAKKVAAIPADPAKCTTELLRQVFGQ